MRLPYTVDCWSPDGSRIAEHVTGEGVYVMDSDGSNRTLLAHLSSARALTWSPDGAIFAFLGKQTGSAFFPGLRPLIVMNSDGSHRITLAKGVEQYSWSPGGQYIVFSHDGSFESDEMEISIVSVDGKRQSQLTLNSHYDGHPVWQPQTP